MMIFAEVVTSDQQELELGLDHVTQGIFMNCQNIHVDSDCVVLRMLDTGYFDIGRCEVQLILF